MKTKGQIVIAGVVWALLVSGFTSVTGEVGGIVLGTIGAFLVYIFLLNRTAS